MLSRIAAVLAAGIAVFLAYQLYVGGNALLAVACAGGIGLALFVYTVRTGYTYRYLFPGLAGIGLFIVLPVLYTVWIGFTNYSSKNLLTFERATEVLLGEVVRRDNARYQFTLHAAPGGYRIVLAASEDDAAGAPAAPARAFITPPLALTLTTAQRVPVAPIAGSGGSPGDPLPLKDVIAHGDAIRALIMQLPDGSTAVMESLREFTPSELRYRRNADGSLTDQRTHERLVPNFTTGFYEGPSGPVLPGFRAYVGNSNYVRMFTDEKFRGPFLRVFAWTIVFAALSVFTTGGLGLLLAELLSWPGLRFAGLYRLLLFLPYAVPGFISILVFKGLFNRNFGEINLVLDAVLGIRPDWIGNAMLARVMIMIVNTWLGYPYYMLIGMGLQKAIPHELYEAAALAGAGPLTRFFRITWPLIRKPLMPLMVSTFAYNFNNFVVIFLLTAGRPDFLDTSFPAGETDILVSYTYRIAFQDSGQNFGLAAAVSTIIFVIVSILSVINLRLTRANAEAVR